MSFKTYLVLALLSYNLLFVRWCFIEIEQIQIRFQIQIQIQIYKYYMEVGIEKIEKRG